MKGLLLCLVICITGIVGRAPPKTLIPECKGSGSSTLWPDFDDGQYFFRCGSGGELIRGRCAVGTKLHFELQACVHARDWVSPQPPGAPQTDAISTQAPYAGGNPKIESLVPACNVNQLNWLWPNFDDNTRFYKCGAIGWVLSMPCGAGTRFHFGLQDCVLPNRWVAPPAPTTAIPITTESDPSAGKHRPGNRPLIGC